MVCHHYFVVKGVRNDLLQFIFTSTTLHPFFSCSRLSEWDGMMRLFLQGVSHFTENRVVDAGWMMMNKSCGAGP